LHQIPAPAGADDDHISVPFALGASVGAGGVNARDDAKTIQKALNRLDPGLGGADPKLKVDGLAWDKTIAAIRKFQTAQFGSGDGRVDPGRATEDRLNALLLVIWVNVSPRVVKKIYEVLLPKVLECLIAADAALLAARSSLLSRPAIDPGAAAARLVNKHFSLNQNPNLEPDLDMIQGIFRNMLALVHRNLSGVETTFSAFPGRTDWADEFRSGHVAVANAIPHGVAMKGQTTTVHARDGAKLVLRDDQINIFRPFQFESPDGQVCTLVHEMSHYLGGPEGAGNAVDDWRYGSPGDLSGLDPKFKARNADSYGNFAFEAHFHREPFSTVV